MTSAMCLKNRLRQLGELAQQTERFRSTEEMGSVRTAFATAKDGIAAVERGELPASAAWERVRTVEAALEALPVKRVRARSALVSMEQLALFLTVDVLREYRTRALKARPQGRTKRSARAHGGSSNGHGSFSHLCRIGASGFTSLAPQLAAALAN